MRRSESEPLQTIDIVDGLEQLHERALIVDFRKLVAAIKIHNLAEQGYVRSTARNKLANLGDDFLNRTAAFGTTRPRDDAKCAVHVAPLHDRGKRSRLFWGQLL